MKLRLVFTVCLAAAVLGGAGSGDGPFCWGGVDEQGKDSFVPCKKHRRLVSLNLDLATFEGLRICTNDQCVTVSREQFLAAVEAWQGANRAKP